MLRAEQGDVLRISGINWPVLVVSHNRFNEIGEVIVCPILSGIQPNAVHLPICVPSTSGEIRGMAACEQVRHMDLNVRRFTKIGSLLLGEFLDISDTMAALFDFR